MMPRVPGSFAPGLLAGVRRLGRRAGVDVRRLRDPFAIQRRLVPDAKVIFDAGAYIGDVTARYRDLFPAATVHAFEPSRSSAARLERRFRRDTRVRVHKLALAEAAGRRRLQTFDAAYVNSLLDADPAARGNVRPELFAGAGSQEVECTTVDAFCAANEIDRLDILKIDVQGAEKLVIDGSRGMLERGAVRLVFAELIIATGYKDQDQFDELLRHFREAGLDLFGVYDPLFGPRGETLQVDGIFLPR
jgi:FkbM family methyltransferase